MGAPIMYATVDGSASGKSVKVLTGLTNADVADRVLVVHDVTGSRIACSPMMSSEVMEPKPPTEPIKPAVPKQPVAANLKATDFVPYATYIGNLLVSGSIKLVQDGTGTN